MMASTEGPKHDGVIDQ